MKRILSILCIILIVIVSGCSPAGPSPESQASLEVPESTAPVPTVAETPAATVAEVPSNAPETTDTGTKDNDQKPLIMNRSSFPKLDGSTANIPLAQMIAKKVIGLTDKEVDRVIRFNTTPDAYINLITKKADLLLVYEAAEDTQKQIDESGVELEYHDIGKDALVFLVNEKNPVESLTTQQIKDIYTGKIKNWKELGGEDMEIQAFQRNATSGSQALMSKLVMGEATMADAPKEKMPTEMGELLDDLAKYNNEGNAIGYSVYYFAKNMYKTSGLKFIAVNDTEPNNETIAAGTYPFVNPFFAVLRADEKEGSQVRKLADWLLSEDGKALIEESGYVPTR